MTMPFNVAYLRGQLVPDRLLNRYFVPEGRGNSGFLVVIHSVPLVAPAGGCRKCAG